MTVAPARPARRPRDRRAQILAGAADLFARRGFAAVSVQEIGEANGITGAAVYRHFAGKEALLEELLLENVRAWVAVSRTAGDEARAGGRPALDAMVAAAVDLVVERGAKVATYLRERGRSEGAATAALDVEERALARCWARAITEVRPELDRTAIAAREAAVHGVLGALCRRPAVLAQPRPRALVSAGLVAVAGAAEPTGAPPPSLSSRPDRGRTWTAPASRRQEILATAMALFARRGYRGVGLNEVGEALGIAGPSIYEHFDGKPQLLLDAYDQAGALVAAGAATALDRADSAAAALDGLVASFAEIAVDRVDLITVTTREGGALPPEERPRLVRRRRELHETWTSVLREVRPELSAADGHLLVRGAFPLVTGIAQHVPGPRALPAAIDLARRFLLASPEPAPSP